VKYKIERQCDEFGRRLEGLMRFRWKYYLLAVASALLPIVFGDYIHYEARSWWLSGPLGSHSYTYYMFGALFLYVVDIVVVVFVFQLLYKRW